MSSHPRVPTPTILPTADLRRAISRPAWLANRARNALQRPAFIGAISVGTFVTAIVSLVVVPRSQRQAPPAIPVVARPDTLSVLAGAAMARIRLAEAESTVVAARREASATAAAPVRDSVATMPGPTRDSLLARARAIESQLARAEQAPLPASYRALAELPELRDNARVRPLVDSLADIEKERDAFGAVGGVDPVFVALTSRANEIGRSLSGLASAQLRSLQARLDGVAPQVPVPAAPVVDTLVPLATRDSLNGAIRAALDSVGRLRLIAQRLDLEEEAARERATRVAPPLALLASAFVLSAVIGFAAALFGELRRPRVSDAAELERFLGVRVLSTVETAMPSVDRGRREADRAAPPYFDPGAEAYQLAYLGLATEHPAVLTATVTGDDPSITAIVACNLAAVAAGEARTTLVIDLERRCCASAALRARTEPGVVDIIAGDASWTDARTAAPVGRDKSVDLIPFGDPRRTQAPERLAGFLERDGERFARYYDAIIAIVDVTTATVGAAAALSGAEVLYCARPGLTPLRTLRDQLDAIRANGGIIRGVVLWNAERPLLPTPRALAARREHGVRHTAAAR